MKRYIFIILALVIVFNANAQQNQKDSLSEAYSRISTLEETINLQNNRISKLTSDVNEVLKQNLALKKNLNLQPTINKAKSGDIEYRIHEVNGDLKKNEVSVIFIVENTGSKSEDIDYMGADIIDETGARYSGFQTSEAFIKGTVDDILSTGSSRVNYPVSAPLEITLKIYGYNKESQYIKRLEIKQRFGENTVFENLPIKWVTPEF